MEYESPSDAIPMEELTESVTVEALDKLCQDIKQQKIVCEEKEALATVENKILAALEAKACAYLLELNRENYSSPHGTIYLTESWRFKLPQTEEDKAKFFEHLRERGLFDTYATVNSQSYNSYLNKEWEIAKEEGRGMDFSIPGVPEPSFHRKASLRKK